MESPSPAAKNTNAFFAQSALAFGTAMLTMLVAIFYLPADPWPKAFLALGTLFLTTSAFSLAKCVRDAQENQYVVSRIDQARVDRILAEHDPGRKSPEGSGLPDRSDVLAVAPPEDARHHGHDGPRHVLLEPLLHVGRAAVADPGHERAGLGGPALANCLPISLIAGLSCCSR